MPALYHNQDEEYPLVHSQVYARVRAYGQGTHSPFIRKLCTHLSKEEIESAEESIFAS